MAEEQSKVSHCCHWVSKAKCLRLHKLKHHIKQMNPNKDPPETTTEYFARKDVEVEQEALYSALCDSLIESKCPRGRELLKASMKCNECCAGAPRGKRASSSTFSTLGEVP